MKIKKRLKYKSTLPKADFSMNASNMNRAAAEEAHAERAAAQRAAHEETPAQGGGMGAAGAMNIASQGLNFISSLTPQDNDDGIGMSHKASKITSGISTGLDTASQMAGSFNPIAGAAIGGVSSLFKMIKGAVDHKRENDRSITSRLARKEYDPTQDNVGYSFGNGTAKYGMPLFGDGGKPIYTSDPSDKRLQAYNDSLQLHNKAIKDWKGFARLTNNINNPRYTTFDNSIFYEKKPVQPVILKPVPRAGNINIRSESLEGFKNGGKPTYTDNPQDPALHKYLDSLNLYKGYQAQSLIDSKKPMGDSQKKVKSDFLKMSESKRRKWFGTGVDDYWTSEKKFKKDVPDDAPLIDKYKKLHFSNNVTTGLWTTPDLYSSEIAPTDIYYGGPNAHSGAFNPIYKKPVNEIKYSGNELDYMKYRSNPTIKGSSAKFNPLEKLNSKKPEVKVPVPKKNIKGFLENAEKDYWHKDKDVLAFRKVFKEKFGEEPSRNFSEAKYDYDSAYEAGVRPVFNKEDGLYHWDSRFKADDHPNRYVNGVDTKTGEQIKGKSLNDFLKQQRKNPNGGINTYIRKDTKSPWIQQDFALGGDPRAQSNIEAEQGEAMQHSSGKIENIEGQKHENGGTPLQVQPSHEYIYSDSLGYDREGNMTLDENLVRYSFADNAKKIERKYKGRENDSIVQKTKKLELGKLKQDAEQARVAKEEMEMGKQMKKYKAKYGANLKRFDTSGYVPFTNFPGSIGDEAVDPNSTLAMQQQLLQHNPNALPKYGADNKWGPETTAGFVNNPGVYNLQQPTQSSTPQPLFGGGNRINPFVGHREPSRRDNLREAANFYTPGQVGTPKPRAQAQDRQEDIDPDAVKKNGFFGDLTTGDKMQLASMLPAFGFNMGMGLRKADVEPNRKNPYENDVLSMMANRKFDIQNYLNQSNLATNTAKEDIGNNSTSVGGKMANLQKLFANQSNALGDITTKGQEMNNQYRAEEANTKNIIGEANRAESIRAAGINDQNKARKQQFLAKAFEQMGQGLATTGQAANQSLTNKLLIKSLSEISPDFDVKNMKDLQVGDDGYIVFKGVKTEFKMSDEGKIVMAGGTPNTANASQITICS
jgi:hypothetical protein